MAVQPPIIVSDTEGAVLPILLQVLKLTRVYQNLKLAEIGLQNGQDEFLMTLDENRPKPVNQIARDVGVRASTISKMVDILSARGLVERVGSDNDHRKIFVHPTAAGLAAKRAIGEVWDEIERDLIQSAAALNTSAFRRDLDALRQQASKRLARLR